MDSSYFDNSILGITFMERNKYFNNKKKVFFKKNNLLHVTLFFCTQWIITHYITFTWKYNIKTIGTVQLLVLLHWYIDILHELEVQLLPSSQYFDFNSNTVL